METPAPEIKTYKGNCHCGAFKFVLKSPEVTAAYTCDCSICVAKSYLWNFPKKELVTIVQGEEDLKVYSFGTKKYMHKFCGICGTSVMCRETDGEAFGINIRTFNDFDYRGVTTTCFDSANKKPLYVAPDFNGELPKGEDGDGTKVYTGACHCGAVRLALRTKPIPECDVKECDCSICKRNGWALIYPTVSQVSITGGDLATGYKFATKSNTHNFCGTCGVPLYITIQGPPKEVQDSWSDALRAKHAPKFDVLPVNVKILQGVEWDQLKIQQVEDGDTPPLYVVG